MTKPKTNQKQKQEDLPMLKIIALTITSRRSSGVHNCSRPDRARSRPA